MTAPRAKFCSCDREPSAAPGAAVYLKQPGVLTRRRVEASKAFPHAIGKINQRGEVEFTPAAQKALEVTQ